MQYSDPNRKSLESDFELKSGSSEKEQAGCDHENLLELQVQLADDGPVSESLVPEYNQAAELHCPGNTEISDAETHSVLCEEPCYSSKSEEEEFSTGEEEMLRGNELTKWLKLHVTSASSSSAKENVTKTAGSESQTNENKHGIKLKRHLFSIMRKPLTVPKLLPPKLEQSSSELQSVKHPPKSGEHLNLWHTSSRRRYGYLNMLQSCNQLTKCINSSSLDVGKCEICSKIFPDNASLHEHIKIHVVAKKYKCEFCGKMFRSRSDLTRHLRIHTGEKPFQCEDCGKTFSQRCSLTKHSRIHTGEKPFTCDTCGKSFSYVTSLTAHKRSHTKDKPYQCELCEKAFSHSDNLAVHVRTHTGERPYACEYCGMKFTQNGILTKHIRSHTGNKPYKCEDCGKAFANRFSLTCHRTTHTGRKPYRCSDCGKTFSRNDRLTTHRMRIHTNRRPYKCEFCDKAFCWNADLNRHLSGHMGKKHQCEYCGKSFSWPASLVRHIRIHTRKLGISLPTGTSSSIENCSA